jgi:chromosome segregation ATPase
MLSRWLATQLEGLLPLKGQSIGEQDFLCYYGADVTDGKEGHLFMQEDRLDTLERKVAAIELEFLYEKRKARERAPSEQTYNAKEINQNLTILLGIASGQERDIKVTKEDVATVKVRVEQVEQRLDGMERGLASVEQRLDGVEQRLTSVEQTLGQHTALLTQILARLPEKP